MKVPGGGGAGNEFPQGRALRQFYSYDLVFMLPCWARRLIFRFVTEVSDTHNNHAHTHTPETNQRDPPLCVQSVQCLLAVTVPNNSSTHTLTGICDSVL